MKKRLQSILWIMLGSFYAFPSVASAQTKEWKGVCVAGPDHDVATIQGLECLIANVFLVFITILGLVGFVMFMVGAFRWLASGGNSKNVEGARNTMLYAVVGLVVSLSAFVVINLIADFTGVDIIRKFVIPQS